jgi:hypothetical protein
MYIYKNILKFPYADNEDRLFVRYMCIEVYLKGSRCSYLDDRVSWCDYITKKRFKYNLKHTTYIVILIK